MVREKDKQNEQSI